MSSATGRKAFDIETSEAIGRRIRAARGDRTQDHFSKAIGVSRAALTNYEAGRRLPNDLVLKKISEISGVPVHSLLFGNTSVPFEDYLQRIEQQAIEAAQSRPGFIPRFMISDDEYAMIALFRLMSQERQGWLIIREIVEYWDHMLAENKSFPYEPAIQWGEGHLDRLKAALGSGQWEDGFDPLQSYWVTLWEEKHERSGRQLPAAERGRNRDV